MPKIKYFKEVFSIGGISIGIESDTQSTKYSIAWKDFICSKKISKKPDIQLKLIRCDRLEIINNTLKVNEFKAICSQKTTNSSNAISIPRSIFSRLSLFNPDNSSNVFVDVQKDSITIVDFAANEINVFYTPDIAIILSVFFKEPRLIACFFPSFSSAIFHCAGVIRKKRAAIFFAPDNGGKTTVIKNLTKGLCLSDDHLLIKKSKKDFIAYGTPWGVFRNPIEKGEIGGIFILKKSDKFYLEKLSSKQTLEIIWHEHLDYYALLRQKEKMQYFDFLVDFCQTPSYLMHFPKNFVDWSAIDSIIEK